MSVGINNGQPQFITQGELAQFAQLREQILAMDRWVRLERQRLVDLLEAGAAVEAGPLRASLCTRSAKRLTRAALTEIIGEVEYEALRREVAPTSYRQLIVERDSRWQSRDFAGRNGPWAR